MGFTDLYDFEVDFEKESEKIVFDMFQNIELNYKYQQIMQSNKKGSGFSYQLDDGRIIAINFEK